MRKPMAEERLLLVRSGGLGDTVLLWPALQAIRRLQPRSWVVLLGQRSRCELLLVPGGADEAWEIEGSGFHSLYLQDADIPPELAARLAGFDAILAFTGRPEGFLLENLSRCGAGQVHLFASFPARDETMHLVDYLVRCVEEAALGEGGPWEPLGLKPEERRLADACWPWPPAGREAVVLAPGSGSHAKNWPADCWADLAGRLAKKGLRPLLLRGPADALAVAEVQKLAGRLPVLECPTAAALKGALARAALVVGNDSGPVHLAALMGKAALAIFGPTDPLCWAPRGPRAAWIGPQDIDCAPCDDQRRNECPSRHCLRSVKVDEVWQAACGLLERPEAAGIG